MKISRITDILFMHMLWVILVHSFQIDKYVEFPGYRLDFQSLTRYSVKNRIKCVRACNENDLCKSVNIKTNGDEVECDLQARPNNREAYMGIDAESSILCKFHL